MRSSPSTLAKVLPSTPPRRTACIARASDTAKTARSSSSSFGSATRFALGTATNSASPPHASSNPRIVRAAQCSASPPWQRSQTPQLTTGCTATRVPRARPLELIALGSSTTPTSDVPRTRGPAESVPSPRATSRSSGVSSAVVTRTSALLGDVVGLAIEPNSTRGLSPAAAEPRRTTACIEPDRLREPVFPEVGASTVERASFIATTSRLS